MRIGPQVRRYGCVGVAFLIAWASIRLERRRENALVNGEEPEVIRYQDEPFTQLLVRSDEVWALNRRGMFRASKMDRKWHAVDLPSPLSVGGNFARQPPSSRAVYYVVSSIAASSEFQRCRVPGAAHGIYRTLDQGRSWTSVAAGLFGQLVITGDQKLYATRLIPHKQRDHWLIVQVSEDTGRSWREL